jgi:hypothetical protein
MPQLYDITIDTIVKNLKGVLKNGVVILRSFLTRFTRTKQDQVVGRNFEVV